MTKKFQVFIRNTDTGPYKVPFVPETPKNVQARMDGVLRMGKKITISSEIAQYLDLDRLQLDSRNGRIKYKTREIVEIPTKVSTKVPKKKVVKNKPLIVDEKEDKSKTDSKTSSKSNSKKGGK
jgi:hypothetical protein